LWSNPSRVFRSRKPVQATGFVQKRALFTPNWFATFCTSAGGKLVVSSSWFAITCEKRSCSF
jgi:hypothetical protein